MSDHLDASWVDSVWNMAFITRYPDEGPVHPGDRDCQYTTYYFKKD